MKLKRIDHIGIVVPGFAEPEALLAALGLELGRTNAVLVERGVAVSWPPFPSGDALMIWTDAATSGGVQYQFLHRPGSA